MKAPARPVYSGAVHDSLRAASAWRMACYALVAALILVAATALHASSAQRTVLVPYGMYTANNEVKVDGSERDADYLTLLARSDASQLLVWQPKTVVRQIEVFLGRLTPGAYARYNLDLRTQAKKYEDLNATEVFYPSKITFVPPSSVVMEGSVMRWIGEKPIADPNDPAASSGAPGAPPTRPNQPGAAADKADVVTSPATYTFVYAESNGVYGLDKVETQQQ